MNVNYSFMNTLAGNESSRGGPKGHRIQMRGLPYQVSEEDIMRWFSPVVDALHVKIVYNHVGKPTGDAKYCLLTKLMLKKL